MNKEGVDERKYGRTYILIVAAFLVALIVFALLLRAFFDTYMISKKKHDQEWQDDAKQELMASKLWDMKLHAEIHISELQYSSKYSQSFLIVYLEPLQLNETFWGITGVFGWSWEAISYLNLTSFNLTAKTPYYSVCLFETDPSLPYLFERTEREQFWFFAIIEEKRLL